MDDARKLRDSYKMNMAMSVSRPYGAEKLASQRWLNFYRHVVLGAIESCLDNHGFTCADRRPIVRAVLLETLERSVLNQYASPPGYRCKRAYAALRLALERVLGKGTDNPPEIVDEYIKHVECKGRDAVFYERHTSYERLSRVANGEVLEDDFDAFMEEEGQGYLGSPAAADDGPSRCTQPAEPLDDSRPPAPKSMKVEAVDAADGYCLSTPEHEAPHPPPSTGKSVCQLAEDFLLLFTSVEARYHAIIEYVLRLRYKRSTEERQKLKDRLETILVDGVPVSHFQKKPDCNMDVLEAYVDVCTGGFTAIQQDLPGLMRVFEAHGPHAQVIRAYEVFTATVVENVRDFCRKLKAVNFPIVEDMLEAMLRCVFKNFHGPKFMTLWLRTEELIRRECRHCLSG